MRNAILGVAGALAIACTATAWAANGSAAAAILKDAAAAAKRIEMQYKEALACEAAKARGGACKTEGKPAATTKL